MQITIFNCKGKKYSECKHAYKILKWNVTLSESYMIFYPSFTFIKIIEKSNLYPFLSFLYFKI